MTQQVERRTAHVPATADSGWPAVVVLDPAGLVLSWSPAAAGMYGWSAADAVGRPGAEVLGAEVGGPGEARERALQVRHRDGTTFTAHVQEVPFDGGTVVLSYPVGESRFPLLAAERAMRASATRATERLRRLQQITAELSRAMTTDEVAETVLTRGMHLEGAGSGAVYLLDEAATALRLVRAGGTAPGLPRFLSIPIEAELPGPYVVRSSEPLYLRSVADRNHRWPELADVATAMEAQAILPLVVDDRAIGCLSLGFAEERDFGEGERDFLAALTNVTAQALDRARLYDAERAASQRVAFLAEAGAVLNGSLDYPVTIQRTCALLRDAFGAEVVVDPDVAAGSAEADVLRTGTPRLLPDEGEGPALVVPLTARGRVTGLLHVRRPPGAAAFTDDDLALAADLGGRAGSAVENARLFAVRTDVAVTLQRSLLPPRLPDVEGVELGARYRPSQSGLEVGGDFYDCYPVGDAWAFMIGDVVGTGPAAAAITAVVRHTARAVAPYVDGPAAVVLAVRDALVARDEDETFCTMLYGMLRAAPSGVTLSMIGAGHPHPYVVRAGGAIEKVMTTGGLLSVLPPVGIEPMEIVLGPGDAFVSVTDGVLEARSVDGDGFFDEERLRAVLAAAPCRTADEIAGAVEEAVLAYTGGRIADDLAVFVLRPTP